MAETPPTVIAHIGSEMSPMERGAGNEATHYGTGSWERGYPLWNGEAVNEATRYGTGRL